VTSQKNISCGNPGRKLSIVEQGDAATTTDHTMNTQQKIHLTVSVLALYLVQRNTTLSIQNAELRETETKLTSECETLRRITDMHVRESREQVAQYARVEARAK